MRTPDEIRAAIEVLERTIVIFPPGSINYTSMAGEIAALRYVIGDERVDPTLADTLPKMCQLFAEYDAAISPAVSSPVEVVP